MALLWSTGFELQSTTNGMEWDTTSGAPSISTAVKRSGTASLRCNPSAASAYIEHQTGAGDNTNDIYIRFYIRIASSTGGLIPICRVNDTTWGDQASIRINSNNTLELWDDENNLQKGSDSSAIPADEWHRVELGWVFATRVYTAYLDGVSFASATYDAGQMDQFEKVRIGILSNATCDIYFDDITVNDNTGSASTGLAGEGSIVHMHPNAAGDNNPDLGDYTAIDEVGTPNDATDFIDLDTATSIGDFNVESSSNAGIDAANIIKYVEVGVRIREEASAATSYQLRLKSAASGTTSTSTASDAGDTTWRTNPSGTGALNHQLISYTDPTTGVAWTPTGTNSLDNMQIGVASLTTNDIDVTALWAKVEFGPSVEQEGFRFRNDDGSESAATWKAIQDTNVTSPLSSNIRLRMLVNSIDNPDSTAYRLYYKKSTDSTYVPVLIGATSALPTFVNAGTVTRGTGAIAPALPASLEQNDILLLFIETGGGTAGANPAITDEAGGTWTQVADSPQSVGTTPDTDPYTKLAVFWSRYNGTQTAPTVNDSGNHQTARILAFRGCETSGDPWNVTSGGTEAASDTSGTIGGDTTTVDNCLIVAAITGSGDPAANGTAGFSLWANADLANVTERSDMQSTTGSGGDLGIATGELASQGAYGDTTVTLVTAGYKAFMTIALKPPAKPIYIATSANITASGEVTTVQLTAPSGKATSDFDAGRMWDDENGTDSVDITEDNYTELEWCLQAQTPAVNDDIYQFRVYAGGVALNTYSFTPEWTIGTIVSIVNKIYQKNQAINRSNTY